MSRKVWLRNRSIAVALSLLSTVAVQPTRVQDAPAGIIDIPCNQFTLDNGLPLLVYADDKAPIVAVNVRYDAGSPVEKPGKSGCLYLLEHLIFKGSEH